MDLNFYRRDVTLTGALKKLCVGKVGEERSVSLTKDSAQERKFSQKLRRWALGEGMDQLCPPICLSIYGR